MGELPDDVFVFYDNNAAVVLVALPPILDEDPARQCFGK
jgi:hypothetical protein